MNLYNDFDKNCCDWTRELIKEGHIAPGEVLCAPIQEIKPHELSKYTQCHFFAGIGGWSLALQLAGWPINRPVGTGSCPCQPFSAAGLGKGNADARHLWPAFFQLIVACRALGQRWTDTIFGEQVESAIGHGWLDSVSADMEGEGYAVGAAILGAHSVGAPHRRQRLYWVAYDQGQGWTGVEPWDEPGLSEWARIGSGGAVDPVADAERSQLRTGGHGCPDETPTGVQGQDGKRQRIRDDSREYGEDGPLDNPASPRLNWSQPAPEGDSRDETRVRVLDLGGSNGVAQGDTDGAGPQGRGLRPDGGAGEQSPWSSGVEFITCTDGRKRLVKPGIFPLAHGFPGRVGLLRGSGNAIVPQVAAAFIQASEEVRHADANNGSGLSPTPTMEVSL